MLLELIKPEIKSVKIMENPNEETFEISPLEKGLGNVFGNSLRTVMLAQMPGYAVTNFNLGRLVNGEFENIPHYYETVKGINVDGIEIFVRLKQIIVKSLVDKVKEVSVIKEGPCIVTAKDLMAEGLEILNPDLELFEITSEETIRLSITVKEGRGYKLEEYFDDEKRRDNISIDADFSPVKNVGYEVSDTRLNGVEGYEKVTITVLTNGVISPKEAINIAIKIAKQGFDVLEEGIDTIIENDKIYYEEKIELEETVKPRDISILKLSPRSSNALKLKGINTIEDLTKFTEHGLMQVRNIGKNSFNEIKEKLLQEGIELAKK